MKVRELVVGWVGVGDDVYVTTINTVHNDTCKAYSRLFTIRVTFYLPHR